MIATIRASMILSAVLLVPTLAVFRKAMMERAGATTVQIKAEANENGQA